MKILIVEDEQHLAEGLRFNLELEDYEPLVASDGTEAMKLISTEHFDAIVLDVMLPGDDGFTIAKKMREAENFTPILMLTALGKPEDVLQGFESGADDYLAKPFDLEIFLARLKGLLRRREWFLKDSAAKPVKTIQINGRTVDFQNLELTTETEVTKLTLMEAKLLRHLINKGGEVVSRKEILQDVWGLNQETDTRAIDNFIVRLRRLIEDEPNNPKVLQTVRGIGYRFVKSSE
jgi:DNA-binding response OmpR family regulator